jgi:membrane protein DedA with SNARE-associated domain
VHVAGLLHSYGYGLVFTVLFVESLGIPSPSEITLVAAGAAAARGALSFPLVVAVAALGSLLGAQVAYFIGLRGGRALVLRYGARVGLTAARLDQVELFFQRRGLLAVVIGRVLSGVRAIISYPAGIFRMPWLRFTLATAVGAVLWPLLAGLLGRLVGVEWSLIVSWLRAPLTWAVAGALLVAAALTIRFRRRR